MTKILADLLPPLLTRSIQRRRSPVRFEGPYESWSKAVAESEGYDDEVILSAVLRAASEARSRPAGFERDGVVFDRPDYVWPLLSGLLWTAARHSGSLRVLDFGGSLGSTYYQHRVFLKALPEVRWGVVEQPHFVDAGRSHFEDSELRFYNSIEQCVDDQRPNTVLLSSVLQYLEEPIALFRSIESIGADVLIIDRTPLTHDGDTLICVQRVSDEIYPTSYPVQVFAPSQLEVMTKDSWSLIADFRSAVDPSYHRVGRHRLHFAGGIYQARTPDIETSQGRSSDLEE